MNFLIKPQEKKTLEHFLTQASAPELTFSYHELCGYIYGLAITPEMLRYEEWLSSIFGDNPPQCDVEKEGREAVQTIEMVMVRHRNAATAGELTLPFDVERLDHNHFEPLLEWVSGFEEALALRPEYWEEQDGLTEEEQDELANSLIVLEGVVCPEDAVQMFDKLPEGELLELGLAPDLGEEDKILAVQYFMLQALDLSVATLTRHGINYTERFFKRHELCRFPEQGSAKKGEGKKEGKLIRVDFSRAEKTERRKIYPRPWNNYQLEISLAYSDPEIFRLLQIPGNFTLEDLHLVLQLAMGWRDRHLHVFQIGSRFYGPKDDGGQDPLQLDERRFTLGDFESELLQGVLYTYDFGDEWQHVIRLTRIIPEEHSLSYPMVLDGQGACPPEDIGGIPMFRQFLEYLADPGCSQELAEIFEGSGLADYDPHWFDMEETNKLLRGMYAKR